jgi:cell filamentation protein
MSGRYEARGIETEHEPGSRGRVLRNLCGITRVRDIQQAESEALLAVQEWALERYAADHRFVAADTCDLHRRWLGGIYAWAGSYRLAGRGKGAYFSAIRAVLDRDYGPLQACFKAVIRRSLRHYAEQA